MYRKYLHKILAVILLGVFAINTAPREFIHEFAGHHDTDDAVYYHDGPIVSTQHRHCDFLQIAIEPYDIFVTAYIAPVQQLSWVFYPLPLTVLATAACYNLTPRAPPATAV